MINHQVVLDQLRKFSTPDRPLYLVGGAVRDLLLNRPVHDLDFAVPGPTLALARQIANELGGGLYVMDAQRDTTRVVLNVGGAAPRLLLDFAMLRAESLEMDLRSRDFTINAMALDVAHPENLIDPLGGLADLQEKRIRACLPTSLLDDPVRVLRAVRQALSFTYRIEPDTLRQARVAAAHLERISPERRRDELFKMLGGRQVATAVEVLDHLGAIRAVLPELIDMKGVLQSAPHVDDVWAHTLAVVSNLEILLDGLLGQAQAEPPEELTMGLAMLQLGRFREQLKQHFLQNPQTERSPRGLLFMAALYHDIEKPNTRSTGADGKIHFLGHPESGVQTAAARARALVLSNDEVQRLERIVGEHMRCHFLATDLLASGRLPSRRSIYRFFRDTGAAGVDVCLLSLADVRGTYGVTLPQQVWAAELDVCRELLQAYWEQDEQIVTPPRLLSGHDVIKVFALKPGPLIGLLLDAIRENQAAGEITSREEALAFAQRWLAQTPEEREEGEIGNGTPTG